jgi:hypothetical protein
MGKKKDVAHGMVQSSNPEARYHGRPIPPKYAMVEVMWMHDHHDDDELDFPNEEGDMTLGRALSTCSTPGATKAQDVTNIPSLKPKSKSWQIIR